MDPDINSETLETSASKESQLVSKNDANSDTMHDTVASRIKIEPSEDHWEECDVDNKEATQLEIKNKFAMDTNNEEFQAVGVIEELFIKTENDQSTGAMSVLNSIKSELNDWDEFDADNKNNLDIKIGKDRSGMEIDSEIKEEPIVKNESDEIPDLITETDLSRIKNECKLEECAAPKNEDLDLQLAAVKPETDVDSEEFKLTGITEEYDIKSESETTMDAVSDVASNSMGKSKISRNQHQVEFKKAGRESFSCYNCNHTVYSKHHLISHMKVHDNQKHVHFPGPGCKLGTCSQCHVTSNGKTAQADHTNIERTTEGGFLEPTLRRLETAGTASSDKLTTCIHCNATFTRKVALDDHIIRKHPDFITSVARKIYECTECFYKTSIKANFNKHFRLVHSNNKIDKSLIPCIHCNATFKNKASLNNHLVKKHPNFIMSVTNKIYECTKCIYKTTFKYDFHRHLSVHPEIASCPKRSTCIHCNASLNSKTALDDHIVRKHPNLAASVGRKILECTKCSFRTITKGYLNKHILTHSKTVSKYKVSTCIHCNAAFKKKTLLDDHILEKHPDFITSINRIIYECTSCTYKTTVKKSIERHMSVHPQTPSSCKLCTCIHCNATFKSKKTLDDHVVKKHPEFITSVPRRIHECKLCFYKTIYLTSFKRHMTTHPETAASYEYSRCDYCDATPRTKTLLDEHVLKKHPNFFTSSSKKIYECSKCDYKTTLKANFDRHASSSVHLKSK